MYDGSTRLPSTITSTLYKAKEGKMKVNSEVIGLLPHLKGPRGTVFLAPPGHFIVRRLYQEGGATLSRPPDPKRGWHIEMPGVGTIFRPEYPPDIYVGREYFKNFVEIGG